jgi:hypothetical protein
MSKCGCCSISEPKWWQFIRRFRYRRFMKSLGLDNSWEL